MKSIKDDSVSTKLKVAVLMGGTSNERSVSLATGRQIVQALDKSRYAVRGIDTDLLGMIAPSSGSAPGIDATEITRADRSHDGSIITTDGDSDERPTISTEPGFSGRADVVFIALHGKGGEDGTVQGLLEFAGIPYTGSGVLASALAMDKTMTKLVLRSAGVRVIEGVTITRADLQQDTWSNPTARIQAEIGFPVFIKPNREGSTVGCSLVTSPDQFEQALEAALRLDASALVERYVVGTELTIGVLEKSPGVPEALPVVEIVPKSQYYDFDSKYAEGGSEHIIPANIGTELSREAQETALQCHKLIGCRGVSRTDMILSDGKLYILEINTIPGMTPTSLLPQAAAEVGIEFPELLDIILAAALYRDRE